MTGGSAAHVALHVLHARRRLDGNAAAVEANALAHEGERRLVGRPARPAHDAEPRRPRRAPRHAKQRVHAQPSHLIGRQDFYLEPQRTKRLELRGEFDRAKHVGRLAHQFTGQQRALHYRHAFGRCLIHGALVGNDEGDFEDGGLITVRGLRLVLVETVVPKAYAGGDFSDCDGAQLGIIEHDSHLPDLAQLGEQRAAAVGEGIDRRGGVHLARAEHQQAIGSNARWRRQLQQLPGSTGESGGLADGIPVEARSRPTWLAAAAAGAKPSAA